LILPFYEAVNFIFSSIFSQTLGTPKNKLGLTSLRVSTNDPYKADGSAKYTTAPVIIHPTISDIYAAT
jgi:hypothetical protein